jgi:hypothetical protein
MFCPIRADDADGQYLYAGKEVAQTPVCAQHTPELHPKFGEVRVLLRESVHLVALASKRANHPDAGEVFLRNSEKLSLGLVGGKKPLLGIFQKYKGVEEHDRDERERSPGHHRIHPEEYGIGEHDQHDRPEHLYHLAEHEIVNDVHIGCATLDYVPGLYGDVPCERQMLYVRVEPVAQMFSESLRP